MSAQALDQLRFLTLGELLEFFSSTKPEPRYIDLKSTGLYRQALEAIKAGQLRAHKLPGSRKYWVLTEDFHAWIESPLHRVQPSATKSSEEDEHDSIDRLIDEQDRRRVG